MIVCPASPCRPRNGEHFRLVTTAAYKTHQDATPFHPFTLHLNDGRAVAVKHPDFVALTPRGWEAMVWTDDYTYEFIDLDAIASLKVTRQSRR
jgi:hypothetical protein